MSFKKKKADVCVRVVQVRESEQGTNTASEADLKSRWEREREGKRARDYVLTLSLPRKRRINSVLERDMITSLSRTELIRLLHI